VCVEEAKMGRRGGEIIMPVADNACNRHYQQQQSCVAYCHCWQTARKSTLRVWSRWEGLEKAREESEKGMQGGGDDLGSQNGTFNSGRIHHVADDGVDLTIQRFA